MEEPRFDKIWDPSQSSSGDLDHLPPIAFGAATFGNAYSSADHLHSEIPLSTVRLALKYGLAYFDTSPYYGESETVLGNVLAALKNEFPRESYKVSQSY